MTFLFEKCSGVVGVCACVYGHLKPYVFLSSHIFFFLHKDPEVVFFICNATIFQTKYYLCKSEFVVCGGRR